VSLDRIRLPILCAYGLRDHLVPPAQAQAVVTMAPDAQHADCALDAGHIGIFVSRRARGMLGARLVSWLDGLGP
jgi:polyhydroxyalkanoate synthase